MDLLDKLRAIEKRRATFADGDAVPGQTVIERVLGPCEVVVDGRPTLMFGSNNYLGPDAASRRDRGGPPRGRSSTAPAPPARAPPTARWRIHEDLEREFADWFGKRHAIIFSTGYQANLSLIGGLCGAGDVILIDRDSHASIYDATRQTAAQVIGFRHNSAESLRKKLERLPAQGRNRLVVVEGLYSIRGDVAPLREIVDVCRAHGAYLLVDEAHSLGTYGRDRPGLRRRSGRPRRGRLRRRHVLEVAGRHRRRLRVESSGAARAAFPGARLRVHRVGFAVERRQRQRRGQGRARRIRSCAISCGPTSGGCARACASCGYVIGETESPIVPILTGDEERTIALWQRLLQRRAVREPDRAARLPGRRVRAARELLGRAHARSSSRARSTSSAASARRSASRAPSARSDSAVRLYSQPALPIPRERVGESFAQSDLRDDAEAIAQPIDAADESL